MTSAKLFTPIAALLVALAVAPALEASDRRARGRGRIEVSRRCDDNDRYRDHRDHRSNCECSERWIPGHYRTVCEQVEERGYYEDVWVPARTKIVDVFGCEVRVVVREGYYERVYRPGRVRTVERRIWVPGTRVVDRCRHHS
ncbi:MAG: hypothetical protein ACKVX7_16245 [Planctomycetota bacterium]